MKASSCDSLLDYYLKPLLEHDYDYQRMNYALVNDSFGMMNENIWNQQSRAYGVVYGWNTFLIRAAWRLARGVYIGWTGSL